MNNRQRKWFDIGTTAWAITLLVVFVIYLSTSAAYAGPRRGEEGLDCYIACEFECEEEGGCDDYWDNSGDGCFVGCREGVARYLPC